MHPYLFKTILTISLCLGYTSYSVEGKSCHDPGTPWKGRKIGELQIGETLYFSCPPCHQLRGSATRTCLSNLTWSGHQPTCTAVFCSSLQHPRNGRIIAYSRFCSGTRTKFECFPGYQLIGSRRITCQSNGKWSAAIPTCVAVQCSLLQNPTNGYLTSNSRQYDSVVQYRCDYGYQLNGSPQRHCQSNGTWTGNEPVCEIKSCKDPGAPWRGSKNGNLQVGQTLYFSCAPCYRLRGSSTRTCLSNLTWSGSQPTCAAVRCGTLRHPTNGRIISFSGYCGRKPTEFICYAGYQLVGSRRITCQSNGKWSAAIPTCVAVQCSLLQNPTNGYLTSNSRQYDSVVQYRCDDGYQLNGSPRRHCQRNGTWTGNEPACEIKSCKDPGAPWRGSKNGNLQVGQTLYFSCAHCYRLRGSSTRTCLSNLTWSGRQPTCAAVRCVTLRHPTNGRIVSHSGYCGRKPTEFICYAGYRLVGSRRITCQSNGKWSAASPVCVAVTTTPTTSKILQRSTMFATATPEIHSSISSLSFNEFATTLAAGSSCGNPVLPSKAKISYLRKNVLVIRCKENYVTVTAGFMLCTRNIWRSVTELSCIGKSCADPGIPRNDYKHGSSYLAGDVVTFTCNDCYRLVGYSKITCLTSGSWSHSIPRCALKKCPPPRNTSQATVSYVSVTCNAVATYTCKDTKLIMVGSGKKICSKSGMWEGAEPQCINVNIALGKPVSVSSIWDLYSGRPASVIADGNRKGRFVHTRYEVRAWFKIDLLKEEHVSTVIVVNRRDCCPTRIDGFKVSVGNDGKKADANTECGGRLKAKVGENFIQCATSLQGRYVFVYMKRFTSMTLHEVEVYRRRMTE